VEAKKGSVKGGDYYVTSSDKIENQGSMRFLAGYIQDEITLAGGGVHIQLGLRFDHVRFYDGNFEADGSDVDDFSVYNGPLEENSWSTLSPRAGIRLNPSSYASGYISYGRGFRASILDDLSRSGWMWVGPKIANPELGPEIVDNIEAGLDLRPHWKWRISPTAYYSKGKDFLYYVATGDRLWGVRDIYRRENVSGVRLYGMELDVLYVPTDDITLNVAYSVHRSEIRSFPERPALEGSRLTYSPERMVHASLQWENALFDSGLRFLYTGKQYADEENTVEIDDYVTVDLMFSRQIAHGASLSLEIMNVFDNTYMENQFYLSPGRLVTVSVGYSW
ncbi:TonB-dependent receptor, partial [Balneolaceae bacterium ANBcel3]|nr:TonB-dependent receptor [Balneolaceae bacterium ANBcel3]